MERVYHVDSKRALRTHMTLTTFKAVHGQVPPVRLLATGRVFRPDREDAGHLKVFHQVDGIAIEPRADATALRATCERILKALLGQHAVKWRAADFPYVDHGMEMLANPGGKWKDICGCGLLKSETLREAGYDPDTVHGYAFGFGLERLAMLKFGIDDVRKLWQPPYVTK